MIENIINKIHCLRIITLAAIIACGLLLGINYLGRSILSPVNATKLVPREVIIGKDCDGSPLEGLLFSPNKGIRAPSAAIFIAGSGSETGVYYGISLFDPVIYALIQKNIEVLLIKKRADDKYYAFTLEERSKCISQAAKFMRQRNTVGAKIFFIGHSEGALMCLIAASLGGADGLVLLGAPSVAGHRFVETQLAAVARADGVSDSNIAKGEAILREVLLATENNASQGEILEIYKKNGVKNNFGSIESAVKFGSSWGRSFCRITPQKWIESYGKDVLMIFGEKDCQVPIYPNATDAQMLKNAAGHVDVIIIPSINHLMRMCQTGSVSEYPLLKTGTDPRVTVAIQKWIVDHL